MLRLHGFSASNYYNVAKLALLEKGAAFEEVLQYTGVSETYCPEYLEASPLGKVPCLETPEGFLTESRCIVDYVERALPGPALYPSGTFAQAKLLELTQIIDLYLELAVRRLLPYVFSGKTAPDRLAGEVRETVTKAAQAVQKLARFDAYLLGAQFTAADIAGVVHFPVGRRLCQSMLGCDPLGDIPGLRDYLARLSERETVKRVNADRAESQPKFMAFLSARYGIGQG